jgi:hypothetical protein
MCAEGCKGERIYHSLHDLIYLILTDNFLVIKPVNQTMKPEKLQSLQTFKMPWKKKKTWNSFENLETT